MSSISLNRRINRFIEAKHREMPELRDQDVDLLIADLIREGRSNRTY